MVDLGLRGVVALSVSETVSDLVVLRLGKQFVVLSGLSLVVALSVSESVSDLVVALTVVLSGLGVFLFDLVLYSDLACPNC